MLWKIVLLPTHYNASVTIKRQIEDALYHIHASSFFYLPFLFQNANMKTRGIILTVNISKTHERGLFIRNKIIVYLMVAFTVTIFGLQQLFTQLAFHLDKLTGSHNINSSEYFLKSNYLVLAVLIVITILVFTTKDEKGE